MIETDPEKRHEQYLRMHKTLTNLTTATAKMLGACVPAKAPSYVEGYGMTYLAIARRHLDLLEKELLKEPTIKEHERISDDDWQAEQNRRKFEEMEG